MRDRHHMFRSDCSVAGYCGDTTSNSPANLTSANYQLGFEQPCVLGWSNRLPIESQKDSGTAMTHCRLFSKMIPQYLSGLRSRELANVQGFAISMDSNSLLRTKPVTSFTGARSIDLSAVPCTRPPIRPSQITHSLVKASPASGDKYRQPD